MRPSLLAVVVLSACGTGLEPNPDDSASGGVSVEALDPDFGPTDGGTVVTLGGKGFEGSVQAWFGQVEVDVTRVDSETLLVSSPPSAFEVPVDVRVHSDLGEDVLVAGFTYSDDGNPDTGDSGDSGDTDTGVEPTGKTGGLLELALVQIACPDCIGATSDVDILANVAFHEPSTKTWSGWLPENGSCVVDPVPDVPTGDRYDVGEWVYLTSGSVNLGLRRTNGDSGVFYEATNLGLEDFLRNAAYDLSAPDGGELGDAFDIEDAAITPQGFTEIQPVEVLYVSPDSAFSAQVHKNGGTSFSWSPSGGTGRFAIVIDAYSPDGVDYYGQLFCIDDDNGSMSVPGSPFADLPNYSLLLVGLYRYQIEENVLPGNGATMQAIARTGVLGTGILVP